MPVRFYHDKFIIPVGIAKINTMTSKSNSDLTNGKKLLFVCIVLM